LGFLSFFFFWWDRTIIKGWYKRRDTNHAQVKKMLD
jgi:hypothetical protein